VSSEATVMITKVTEIFLQYLSSKSMGIASQHGRKTIKNTDLIQVIYSNHNLQFLRPDFPNAETTSNKRKVTTDIVRKRNSSNKDESTKSNNIMKALFKKVE
jgi:hypothetical protein